MLYLVPLLQGTEVIVITIRSLSVDSLGTTHIVWDIYSRPAEYLSKLVTRTLTATLLHYGPRREDTMSHRGGRYIKSVEPDKRTFL